MEGGREGAVKILREHASSWTAFVDQARAVCAACMRCCCCVCCASHAHLIHGKARAAHEPNTIQIKCAAMPQCWPAARSGCHGPGSGASIWCARTIAFCNGSGVRLARLRRAEIEPKYPHLKSGGSPLSYLMKLEQYGFLKLFVFQIHTNFVLFFW